MKCAITLLLITSMLISCGPVRPKLGSPVNADFAAELIADWRENSSRIETIKGLARVQVEAPMNNVNGTQVVLVEKPDKLRAETLTPFGVPMLTVTADGKRLGVSLPAQNLYYVGSASPENLDLFLHIPLELKDLIGALLYQSPLIEAWKEEAYALQEGGWLIQRYGPLSRQELIFNAKRQLVEVAFFEDNDLKVKITYARFPATGVLYPSRLALDLPEKHATLNLEFPDVEINGQIKSSFFAVQPPEGAELVYLPD